MKAHSRHEKALEALPYVPLLAKSCLSVPTAHALIRPRRAVATRPSMRDLPCRSRASQRVGVRVWASAGVRLVWVGAQDSNNSPKCVEMQNLQGWFCKHGRPCGPTCEIQIDLKVLNKKNCKVGFAIRGVRARALQSSHFSMSEFRIHKKMPHFEQGPKQLRLSYRLRVQASSIIRQ